MDVIKELRKGRQKRGKGRDDGRKGKRQVKKGKDGPHFQTGTDGRPRL